MLGHLLFNLFIINITLGLKSTCVLFADDVLLYRSIKSIYDVLKQDLDKLYNWYTDNGIIFNATKSKPVYMLGHSQLSITSSFKGTHSLGYLGYKID